MDIIEILPKGYYKKKREFHDLLKFSMQSVIRALYLVKLDISQQHYGLTFGHLWLLLEPIFQAATYYFLLTVIFSRQGADASFAFFLVPIIFWRSHASLMVTAPNFFSSKGVNYIENLVGLNIALLEFFLTEIILFSTRFLSMLIFLLISGYNFHYSWFNVFPLTMLIFLFSSALSIWLAIAGLFFKDMARFVAHFVWLWWYISPGLYKFENLPNWAERILLLNPFSYFIPALHKSLLNIDSNPYATKILPFLIIFGLSLFLFVIGVKILKRLGYLSTKLV